MLVVVDIVASVALLLFAIGMTMVSLSYTRIFPGFTENCGDRQYPGLECNATALAIATYGLLVVTILAMFGAVGMVVIRLIQKRYTFLWPLGAVIVLIAAFWVAAWLAGQTVPTT